MSPDLGTAWWAEHRKGELPDFVEAEFEAWWFEFYNAVPRDKSTWGVTFRDRYWEGEACLD